LPQSPEAGIAGGKVLPSASPLWLLFPGRESISPNQAAPAAPAAQTPVPQITAAPPSVSQMPATHTSLLQTGLFSRQENAQTQADNLKKAGFAPEVFPRQVNGANYWAVGVPYGNDMSSMIRRLKDAGFDSFPINL